MARDVTLLATNERLARLGVGIPEILLPASGTDMTKWAVVACDQFSSERHYWEETARLVGPAPSTLRLILPECYLEDGDPALRVEAINATMGTYLTQGTLRPLKRGFVLLDRSTPFVASRKGLVMAVDLEQYSFETGSTALIRPTEGTILKRLPPRMNIRRGAALDLPHILLLVDDPKRTLIEPLFAARNTLEQVYDFDLLQNGGHITGWHVPENHMESIATALEELARSGLLFAVGDGNHSLAAAKQLWEEKKSQGAAPDHPARWALVEVENIHDEGLPFHPIHRLLFNVEMSHLKHAMEQRLGGVFRPGDVTPRQEGARHSLGYVFPSGKGNFVFERPGNRMTVEFFQEFLDDYLAGHQGITIDYIHGEEALETMASAPGNAGFLLPEVSKETFFSRIVTVGVYPRKTFSIGEAPEKRYYLEARKLLQ